MNDEYAAASGPESDRALETAVPQRRFSGPAEFSSLVRGAFAAAAAEGWREIIVSDDSFSDWPLGERAVIESLNNWAQSGRQFTMLAASYDELRRRHARFVTWRQTWSHVVECRVGSRGASSDVPSALWSASWALHRLDPVRVTGVAGMDRLHRVALRERLSAQLLKSAPGFAATTLGL